MSEQGSETPVVPEPIVESVPSAAATGDLRPGGVSGIRLRPQRERPPRETLVPKWLLPAALAALGAVVVIAVLALFLSAFSSVQVPRVIGEEIALAKIDLQRAGLSSTVSEQRFSTLPKGTVIEQRPGEGAKLRRGSAVALVVSAGTDTFGLPDVIGDGLQLARGTLEGRGLTVIVQVQPSTGASGTVLSSDPVPGATVHTGDIVSLTVAATNTVSGLLTPSNLAGIGFAIDPQPASPGQLDVTLDLAHRVEALIEASGGHVIVTRSVSETSVPSTLRAQRIRESTATVVVVLDAEPGGAAGAAVISPSTGDPVQVAESRSLASQIASSLASQGIAAPVSAIAPDAVLQAAKGPAVKVLVGSFASPADVARFHDASWADMVAQSIYRGIGSALGAK